MQIDLTRIEWIQLVRGKSKFASSFRQFEETKRFTSSLSVSASKSVFQISFGSEIWYPAWMIGAVPAPGRRRTMRRGWARAASPPAPIYLILLLLLHRCGGIEGICLWRRC